MSTASYNLLVFVKTDPEIRHEGVSTFILEEDR